jgi:hypothetical protein
MKIQNLFTILLLVSSLTFGGYQIHEISTLISPIAKAPVTVSGPDLLRKSLTYLGCPRETIPSVQSGIEVASAKTGIGRILLASLLFTESNFRGNVVSKKGYVGIAQTPTASIIYKEVDILHGAMILQDKIRYTNGNIVDALMLYKGGRNPEARKQAHQVIAVYNNLMRRLV